MSLQVAARNGNRSHLINWIKPLVLLFALCAVGCVTTAVRPEATLVGRWRYQNAQQLAEYIFAQDGSFVGHVSSRGVVVADFTGKWSLTPEAIVYEYTSDKKGSIAPGTRDRDQLVSLGPDAYVIQARDGSQRKYVRVTE